MHLHAQAVTHTATQPHAHERARAPRTNTYPHPARPFVIPSPPYPPNSKVRFVPLSHLDVKRRYRSDLGRLGTLRLNVIPIGRVTELALKLSELVVPKGEVDGIVNLRVQKPRLETLPALDLIMTYAGHVLGQNDNNATQPLRLRRHACDQLVGHVLVLNDQDALRQICVRIDGRGEVDRSTVFG